jgi:hypothetical protein
MKILRQLASGKNGEKRTREEENGHQVTGL